MPKALKTFKCQSTKRIYHLGDEYDGKLTKEHQELGNVEIDKPEKEKADS